MANKIVFERLALYLRPFTLCAPRGWQWLDLVGFWPSWVRSACWWWKYLGDGGGAPHKDSGGTDGA